MEKTVWSEYVKGKSYGEISQKLGKSQKAVYNAMERMKKKIILYLG
jgi:DNA-binding CsgD family transcriptional regulator